MNSTNPIDTIKSGQIRKGTETVDGSALDAPIVAFYFSAHWCPPCRGFTPALAEWYNEQNKDGKNVEVVFITCDRDDAQFNDYYKEMPWVALPFGDARISTLKSQMGCQGIPYLVVYKKDGTEVTKNGRGELSQDPAGCLKKWMQ